MQQNKKSEESKDLLKANRIFKKIFNFSRRIVRFIWIDYILYFGFPCLGRIKRKRQVLQYAYDNITY